MNRRLPEISELYAYNRWANARVFDAAGRLRPDAFLRDLGSSYASVRDTLVHIVAAEWVWLERWRGSSPRASWDAAEYPTHAALVERWRAVERDQTSFIEGLTEERLEAELAYTNVAGVPDRRPLWQLLRHVVNHATYHRGQITTMLRQLHAEPVSTDLVLFYRERDRAAQPGNG